MERHLHLFETESEFNEVYNGSGYTEPWVSYIKETSGVTYNKLQLPQHDYVEIGGIKWATMNIGAESVTDTGLYFQWADTQGYTASQVGWGSGQKAFSFDDCKYFDENYNPTKYNNTDGKTVLDLSDDAVNSAWGGNWRMPTTAEFQALGAAVNTAWNADYQGSGVAGFVCTDKTDSSKVLFFPACGAAGDGSLGDVGRYGFYWSSSIGSIGAMSAYSLNFKSSSTNWQLDTYRYYGFGARGVLDE